MCEYVTTVRFIINFKRVRYRISGLITNRCILDSGVPLLHAKKERLLHTYTINVYFCLKKNPPKLRKYFTHHFPLIRHNRILETRDKCLEKNVVLSTSPCTNVQKYITFYSYK